MKEYNNNQNESSKTPLTRDEQKALMEYVRKDNIYSKYYVMIAFMLGTGCRIGEVIGMTWDDINFEKNIINVNHQIIYKKKKNATRTVHYVELPKNRQTRSIPLQSDLKDILLKYKSATYFLSKSSPVECDGYSGFGSNNPWGNFGSVGLSWVFSEENFMSDAHDWMDMGKLRLSWGTNGNREFGDVYSTLSNLSLAGGSMVYYQNGNSNVVNPLYMSRLAAPNLEWEKTLSLIHI